MGNDLSLLAERVTLRMWLLSIILAIAGILLMSVATRVGEAGYHKTGIFLEESGAAVFISGVLSTLWELGGKRAFADEILAKANMSRDLADAGIDLVTYSFKDERINWEQLFKGTCRLDIFVAYAHTWRNTQSERISKLLSDPDAKLRVVLPNPERVELVNALADRFEMKPEVVKQEIDEAKKFFQRREDKATGTVELYFTDVMPLFTCYRFSNKMVFALYNHRAGQQPVPSFVCDREGFLFRFFSEEFEGILADTQRTRRVITDATDTERAKTTDA